MTREEAHQLERIVHGWIDNRPWDALVHGWELGESVAFALDHQDDVLFNQELI
jgi:hypothetical protein